MYTRGLEHQDNFEKKKPKSFINNHQEDRHPGDQPDFNVSVVGSYRDPLSRQVAEGVLITRCSEEILNSKSEFKQPPIVRVRREVNTGV